MHAFMERGVRIPQDIAIAGFDGHEVGAFISPSLTTMEQPWKRMAEVAVELLVDHAGGAVPLEDVLLPTTLRWGDSC